MQVLIITDAATGIVSKGLRFEVTNHIGFVDEEEMPNLLKFMKFLEKVDLETPINYTEYNYYCNDLKAFAYYSTKNLFAKKSKWFYGFKTDQYFSESVAEVKLENIKEFEAKIKEYFKL